VRFLNAEDIILVRYLETARVSIFDT